MSQSEELASNMIQQAPRDLRVAVTRVKNMQRQIIRLEADRSSGITQNSNFKFRYNSGDAMFNFKSWAPRMEVDVALTNGANAAILLENTFSLFRRVILRYNGKKIIDLDEAGQFANIIKNYARSALHNTTGENSATYIGQNQASGTYSIDLSFLFSGFSLPLPAHGDIEWVFYTQSAARCLQSANVDDNSTYTLSNPRMYLETVTIDPEVSLALQKNHPGITLPFESYHYQSFALSAGLTAYDALLTFQAKEAVSIVYQIQLDSTALDQATSDKSIATVDVVDNARLYINGKRSVFDHDLAISRKHLAWRELERVMRRYQPGNTEYNPDVTTTLFDTTRFLGAIDLSAFKYEHDEAVVGAGRALLGHNNRLGLTFNAPLGVGHTLHMWILYKAEMKFAKGSGIVSILGD